MSKYKLGNYSFDSKSEYELAKKEYELIKQITDKYDISNPKTARAVLDKFYPKTKIGEDFEKKLSGRVGVSYEDVQETNVTHIPSASVDLTPSGGLRIFLMIGFILSLLMMITSIIGFGLSGYLVVFLILSLGFAFHLNFGVVREKIPLLKKGSTGATIGFWTVTLCLSLSALTATDVPAANETTQRNVTSTPQTTVDTSIPVYEPEIADKPTAQDYLDDYYRTMESAPVTDTRSNTEQTTPTTYMVWISDTGTKYHSNPNCSNMRNPHKVTIDEAQSMGLTPCKKCKP